MSKYKRSFFQPLKGLTLIELIVVIAIIAILAALAIPKVLGMVESSKVKVLESNAKDMQTIVCTYAIDYDKDEWYGDRNSGNDYDYSEGTLNNKLEKELEAMKDRDNDISIVNPYSDSRVILNWTNSIGGDGDNPAVFITGNSAYSYTGSASMNQLKGTIIIYIDNGNDITIYFTDKDGNKSDTKYNIS